MEGLGSQLWNLIFEPWFLNLCFLKKKPIILYSQKIVTTISSFQKKSTFVISPKLFKMLPKFLLADNSLEAPDTIYVVHNENPRFIIESDIDDFWSNQHIHWIDEEPDNEELIAQLVDEAEEFMNDEFSQEFDEDDEDEE